MKLAQINLVRGQFIPGLGSAQKIEDIEAETQAAGIVVTTSTAKVLIPWERVELVVTEWILTRQTGVKPIPRCERCAACPEDLALMCACRDSSRLHGIAAVAQGAQAHGTGMFAHVERAPQGSHALGLSEQLAAAQARDAQSPAAALAPTAGEAAAQPQVQPPPPSKKGGRR